MSIMKNIIMIIFSIILPIFSVKVTKTNLCINCKFFITDNDLNKYGKCSFFPKESIDYLVNGIKEENYYYCSTSRSHDDMCGTEGKMFKKKNKK